ncbi:hypothetical protein AB0M11_27890 [Streptomyces sp. NPDC051987]
MPATAHRGGALGAVPAFWTSAIACFVGYLAVSRKDTSYNK